MSVKTRAIIWVIYFVAVTAFVVHAYKSGPGEKPSEEENYSFVLVLPENEIPPLSHIPPERWRAWHMVFIERGDSTVERCLRCHNHEEFCDRCHSYVGVPEIEVNEEKEQEHEHDEQHYDVHQH